MGRPASELAVTMTYAEFIDHLADYTIEPWDDLRSDLQAAQIVATIANLHRPRGRRPYAVTDCVLQFGQTPKLPQKPSEIVRQLERFFDRYEQQRTAQHSTGT
jgi:hypothetical protein